MDNWCTHEQGNLADDELDKNVLTCSEHGAQFDVTTGKMVLGPDGGNPDTITPEMTHKIVLQGNDLMVEVFRTRSVATRPKRYLERRKTM